MTARQRRRQPALWLCSAWIAVTILSAVFADALPLAPYDAIVPGLPVRSGVGSSWREFLGTDAIGRSVLSRLVYGARQTVAIGVFATAGALALGTLIGVVAGFFGGRIEAILNVFVDAMLSIPPLVLLLAVAAVGRRGVTTVVVGLVIVGTPTFARLARASAMRVTSRSFVTAARAMGASTPRILVREVLPMVLLNLSSFIFLFMGAAVVVEGTMSFLGLGVPPPAPSWGGMINDGRAYLHEAPQLVFVPAICLVLTVVSLSTVGELIRSRYDSRNAAL